MVKYVVIMKLNILKNDILKRIPVYTDNLDVISSYIVNEQRKAKIRKKEY